MSEKKTIQPEEVDAMYEYVKENEPCSSTEVGKHVNRSHTGCAGAMVRDDRFYLTVNDLGESAWAARSNNPDIIRIPYRPHGDSYLELDYSGLFEKVRARNARKEMPMD